MEKLEAAQKWLEPQMAGARRGWKRAPYLLRNVSRHSSRPIICLKELLMLG